MYRKDKVERGGHDQKIYRCCLSTIIHPYVVFSIPALLSLKSASFYTSVDYFRGSWKKKNHYPKYTEVWY